MKRLARFTGAGILALVATAVAFNVWSDRLPQNVLNRPVAATAIPLAVLGDSNSHSYQDSIAFPPGSSARGGAFRPRTFNWTDVLARLRPVELDSGPWLVWGSTGVVAAGREAVGLAAARAPRKEDYLYNFAHSGAGCGNLMAGRFRQAPRLVALMNKEPQRWQRGVVVIRIGLNDWSSLLDVQARTPDAPQLAAVTRGCVDQLRAAVTLIHASHPATKILIVGIANEADDAAQRNNWVSAVERGNIQSALMRFNDALRALADSTPNAAFFDDAAWFMHRWGSRGSEPEPAFKTVTVGANFVVTNSNGDEPHNALLADDHAGLVFNTLWAQSLVARLRDAFELPLTPIHDDEVARFVLPLVKPAQ
ncbi:MAG: SGNH/GDSL hydrolase family protein [Variovorax sp.]|nr:MAG: SGNH/GDSL hydrolase family protein [Variovorax sp.]